MSKPADLGASVSYDTKPTAQQYAALGQAYDFFNGRLFADQLPACLITLQRTRGAYGYFCGDRFTARAGATTTDEIALNPVHLHRSVEAVLSTLVHEMCHLWQHHFGRPSRTAYHNKEWAGKMLAVGLTPSHTGQPGGKMTGQRMTHYITPAGAFAQAVGDLLAHGVTIAWQDAPRGARAQAMAKRKMRYTCGGCGQKAWAKPNAHLACGDCMQPMEA